MLKVFPQCSRLVGAETAVQFWTRLKVAIRRGAERKLVVVQFLRRLVPKRRPLSKLGRSLSCADPGTYKIHRTEGSRMWMYKPAEDVKEECNLDDAMDMF